MNLYIYPLLNSPDQILCVDEHGSFVRQRDTLFAALDVMRALYDDIILLHDPV